MSTQALPAANKTPLQLAHERIDEYEGSIHALQAFISLTTWDKNTAVQSRDARYSFGRRMTTSAQNRISASTTVTPDVVIQKGRALGYAVEVKYSLPMDQAHWESDVSQLIKYDDELIGWWTETETIPVHCVVMLIEYARSVRFQEFLGDWLARKGLSFTRNVSLIEFSKDVNAQPYYTLRSSFGSILDNDLSNRLHYGIKVPIAKVVGTYGAKKFYDCEPPAVEFMMVTLWVHVFSNEVSEVQFDKKLGGYPIKVDIDSLTADLQKTYGQASAEAREVEFPRRDWVEKAMEEFVRLGFARSAVTPSDDFDYLLIYRNIRTQDVLEYFVNRRSTLKAPSGRQLTLFDAKLDVDN